MEKLAEQIVTIIVDEYGTEAFLERVSDPSWFQALGCVLGYDWHSSGVTTVLTGVLKRAINPKMLGIAVCGGKGKVSRRTPSEICTVCAGFGHSEETIRAFQYSSRMSAKVDNAAIQAGYQLYHHAFFLTEAGEWAVVQQGMSEQDRTARRYHWMSKKARNLVVEPHSAIVGDVVRDRVLNMTANSSEGCRKVCVDIAREKPERTSRLITSAVPSFQKTLTEWMSFEDAQVGMASLSMPRGVNWKALRAVYEFQPRDFEEILSFQGIGPSTVRGLALIAEIVYGEKPCWKDPVKYSFAYGGKDGVPYPVDRNAMDESIWVLKDAVQSARIGDKEKLLSLNRLRRFVPEDVWV